MPDIVYTCTTCDGSATVGGSICQECLGTGAIPVGGQLRVYKKILENSNTIIAEQASQREDLTTALTQIWNKVKDL